MQTLTQNRLKEMAKDETIIAAAAAVLALEARVKVVREIVEPLQQEVVDFYKFPTAKKWRERYAKLAAEGETFPEVIPSARFMYWASDEDMEIYCAEMHKKHRAAGFDVQLDYCPILIAESDLREAQRLLVDMTEEYTGMTADMLLCSTNGLKNYKDYIQLVLTIMTPAAGPKAKELVADAERRAGA